MNLSSKIKHKEKTKSQAKILDPLFNTKNKNCVIGKYLFEEYLTLQCSFTYRRRLDAESILHALLPNYRCHNLLLYPAKSLMEKQNKQKKKKPSS